MRQILRLMTLLALLVITFTTEAAVGDVWKSGNLWYRIADDNVCEVIAPPSGEQPYTGAISIPGIVSGPSGNFTVARIATDAFRSSAITSISFAGSIREIGSNAFAYTHIQSIEFPNSPQLTSIGKNAFYSSRLKTVKISAMMRAEFPSDAFEGCDSLQSFSVASGNPNYKDIDGVLYSRSKLIRYTTGRKAKKYEFPESCTEIGAYAFEAANHLTEVIIPDHITALEDRCFYSCDSVNRIEIGSGVKNIPPYAFFATGENVSLRIGYNVEEIGPHAFDYCDISQPVRIPSSVKKIGAFGFYGTNMDEVTLPEGIEIETAGFRGSGIERLTIPANIKLGDGVFSSCLFLNTLTISDGVKNIPEATFAACGSLRKINFPASVEYIGPRVLLNCPSLQEINVAPGNLNYMTENGVLFTKNKRSLIAYPPTKKEVSYEVPYGVREIQGGAFYGSSYLEKISLPFTVDTIASQAFSACENLQEIKIPERIKTLTTQVLAGCGNLYKVELPEKLETIGSGAFLGCDILHDIKLPAGLKTIGASAFKGAFTGYNLVLPESLDSIGNNAFELSGIGATKELVIPASVTKWGGRAFLKGGSHKNVTILANCPVPDFAFQLNTGIEEVYIAGSVKKIGFGAFDTRPEYASIKKITLEEGITEIGIGALPGLYTDFKLPNSVVKVKDYVCNSPNLKNLELGSGLEEIGYLGHDVTNLSLIVSRAEIPPIVNTEYDMFAPNEVYNKATLYVPEASIDYYKQAPYWSRFLNIKSIEKDLAGVDSPMADNITVTVNGNEINVTGYDGNISVTNLAGRTVYNGPATTVAVSESGLYIVRAADKTWKLMVK